MEILLLPFKFEWDKHNTQHIKRHDIEPTECEEAFFNLPLIINPDITHSQTEIRYHALGKTNTGRNLLMVFTIHSKNIRVITARNMNKKERRLYNEKTKENSQI